MADPLVPRSDSFGSGSGSQPRGAPATVAAGNGLTWWTEGWRLFAASPWLWIAIVIVFVAIMIALALVPLLGSLASTVLSPVLVAGIMAGCQAQDRGGQLTFEHLFSGFSDRLMPLVVVGLLYLAGTVAIALIFGAFLIAVVGVSGLSALMSSDPLQGGWAMLATLGLGTLIALLVATLAALPLMMACWFAPALVMLRHDEPVAAMKTSFFACLANVMPMLVYGLIGIVLCIVASIPFLLGWIVLGPVFAASVYTSYKDIFGAS